MTSQAHDTSNPPSCPICGRGLRDAAFRPFCSRRCADVDLNRWLGEVYRVETEDGPSMEE